MEQVIDHAGGGAMLLYFKIERGIHVHSDRLDGRASLRNKPFEERADGIPTAPFAYPQYPAGVRVEDGAATGAGEALASGATGTTATVVAGAATAAVTTLATHASIALINNQGEIGKALDDMGSSQNVKNLLTAIVTGGALAYINPTLNLPGTPKGGGTDPAVADRAAGGIEQK